MIVLIVLAAGVSLARVLGLLGVEALDSWVVATRLGLALMFLFTASAHFTSMRHDLARMVPPWMPQPGTVVFLTGRCEIIGAIGLLVPATRPAAAVALILFPVAVFPANVQAARAGVTLRGKPATPLALRFPMQILFIVLLWWSCLASCPTGFAAG